MTIANRLHHRARAIGRRQTVLTIVGDDHNVHCLDEAQLDAWWASLAPHRKADLYERDLEAVDGMEPAIADAIGESFVRLRSAEAILNEAKRALIAFGGAGCSAALDLAEFERLNAGEGV